MTNYLHPKNIYRLFKRTINYYATGKAFLNHPVYKATQKNIQLEESKSPTRTDIINYFIAYLNRETIYLEIGVRNPQDNFDHILANTKYAVDPGVEFESNPVDFKLTSDDFFSQLHKGQILSPDIKFDVIFIDGLHLAEQVDRDIAHSLEYIKEDGFIVLHDCNPPTEWHARQDFEYEWTPAGRSWNGTTWKAFLKWRYNAEIHSCCIDSDWGVGILSKKHPIGKSILPTNPFFEMDELLKNKKFALNLISFTDLKTRLIK